MDDSAMMANIMRLGSLIRSLQHPLVSSYARCYLCRVSMRIDASDRAPHWLCINDWMQTYKTQPIKLLWPALEFIVQCVSHGAVSYNDLLPLWEYCSAGNHRSVILCSFVNGISKFYLTEHALEVTKLVSIWCHGFKKCLSIISESGFRSADSVPTIIHPIFLGHCCGRSFRRRINLSGSKYLCHRN